jgi:hypothetical protein
MLADLTKLRDLLAVGAAPTLTDAEAGLGEGADTPSRGSGPISTRENAPEPSRSSILSQAASLGKSASSSLSRLSGAAIAATVASGLVLGSLAGWNMRSPDVMAVPVDPSAGLPLLWIEPAWKNVPRQLSAQDQLHYALLRAPREEQVAAFLAVPGIFPHSHDQLSKAYTQLARIWYRDSNLDALRALQSELTSWKSAKTHEQELVAIVRIAVNLREIDMDGVVEGLKGLARDKISDMYDPALVELSLEICTDAVAASVRAGTGMIEREALQEVQSDLVRQLYRIELPGAANRLLLRAALKRS